MYKSMEAHYEQQLAEAEIQTSHADRLFRVRLHDLEL